jgi:CheY-like chemotaxis protein
MTSVLVVDDEPDLRLLARLLLEMMGHQVAEVDDGQSAITLLTGPHDIEVVLLDLRMPGVSGWDVLASLREAGALDGLGVVVFSAHMEPREHDRALREGARAYLTKPFTDDQLRAALAAAEG